jgi:hypothetical protein
VTCKYDGIWRKSMIDSMKHLKTDVIETAQDESRSLEFEASVPGALGAVYRVLHRLVGDPAEAEDLALEAFLRLYRHNRKADGWIKSGRMAVPGRDPSWAELHPQLEAPGAL